MLPYVLSVVSILEDLLSIKEEWKELWQSVPNSTPFQSPDWLIPYIDVFTPAPLRILLIRRAHQLIGLFPFWLDSSEGPPVLKILGQGVSDYLDGLCREEERADSESFDGAIDDLFTLHAKRWQRRGLPGVLGTSEQQTFYRRAFRALKETSTIELFTLRVATFPIAVLAALCHNRVLYYYIGAFDPEYSRFGLGNLIIRRVIEFAAKGGYSSFDFLRGQEAYKYKWGARDQETWVRRIRLQN